jgi:hypothetical protein
MIVEGFLLDCKLGSCTLFFRGSFSRVVSVGSSIRFCRCISVCLRRCYYELFDCRESHRCLGSSLSISGLFGRLGGELSVSEVVQFGNILSVVGATNTGEELSVVEFISFVDDAVMMANVRISQALSVGGATYLESTVTVR